MRRTTFFVIILVLSAVAAAFAQFPGAEDLLQSVVTIHTDKARGSGFVIDSSGYIVTNSHVIEGAEAAAIRTEDGEFFNRVVVVADDSERDLALLRVPTEELPALCVGTDVGRGGSASRSWCLALRWACPAPSHGESSPLGAPLMAAVCSKSMRTPPPGPPADRSSTRMDASSACCASACTTRRGSSISQSPAGTSGHCRTQCSISSARAG